MDRFDFVDEFLDYAVVLREQMIGQCAPPLSGARPPDAAEHANAVLGRQQCRYASVDDDFARAFNIGEFGVERLQRRFPILEIRWAKDVVVNADDDVDQSMCLAHIHARTKQSNGNQNGEGGEIGGGGTYAAQYIADVIRNVDNRFQLLAEYPLEFDQRQCDASDIIADAH